MRLTKEDIISAINEIHGDKYDCSHVNYVNAHTPISLVCPIHGCFSIRPCRILYEKRGCQMCGWEKLKGKRPQKYNIEDFIREATDIHGNKYGYSKVDFNSRSEYVTITCPIHGDFQQVAFEHLRGRGCKLCAFEGNGKKLRLTTEEFIRRSKLVHGDKYDYSKSCYKTKRDKIEIICPKHGSFSQLPHEHMKGCGCPICGGSIGENNVQSFLERNNIEYIRQYIIPNEYLFCTNKILKVDFYLPQHNTIIEYNGAQHYNSGWFFDENGFQKQIERDIALRNYCKNHHINLIEIPYTRLKQIDNILKNKLKLKKNG